MWKAMQRLQMRRAFPSRLAISRTAARRHGTTETNPGSDLLLQWNGELERDSAAAALYEVWLQIVTRRDHESGSATSCPGVD